MKIYAKKEPFEHPERKGDLPGKKQQPGRQGETGPGKQREYPGKKEEERDL